MTTFGDFDISQDGSQAVLERVQERSDVVLWIPYHNLASTQPSDRCARSIRVKPITGDDGICHQLSISKGGHSSRHRQELMPPVDCWQSIYAVHDDGPVQRSEVQGQVFRAKGEHE